MRLESKWVAGTAKMSSQQCSRKLSFLIGYIIGRRLRVVTKKGKLSSRDAQDKRQKKEKETMKHGCLVRRNRGDERSAFGAGRAGRRRRRDIRYKHPRPCAERDWSLTESQMSDCAGEKGGRVGSRRWGGGALEICNGAGPGSCKKGVGGGRGSSGVVALAGKEWV
jgi:hypothetical protein